MELEIKTILCDRMLNCNIYFLGDTHIGNVAFDKNCFRRAVTTIKTDKSGYWFGMGDILDSIVPTDPRFDIKSLKRTDDLQDIVDWQENEFIKETEIIADRCLGLLSGNHEEQLRKRTGHNPVDVIAHALKVRNLSMSALVKLHFRNKTRGRDVDFYLHHGFGAARTKGAKINKIVSQLNSFYADVYVMGHDHDTIATKTSMLSLVSSPDNKEPRLKEQDRAFLLVPSFFKTYQQGITTYASEKGFPASTIGMSHIEIKLIHNGRNTSEKLDISVVL